jgi:hypothetical protein
VARFVKVGEHLLNLEAVVYVHVLEAGRERTVTVRLSAGPDLVLQDAASSPQATLFLEALRRHAEVAYAL